MFGMGPWEIILILIVVLLLFGARRLPEMAQGLGKGIKEFRKAMKETTDEIKGSVDVDEKPSNAGNKAPSQTTPKDDQKS